MQRLISIPDDVRKILEILEENNKQAYVVGGCVRDSLLGREPKDWDITTNARPNEVKQIFSKENIPVIPTGEKHGTLSLLLNDIIYEVTTYRTDGKYSDGRHADEVIFEDTLEKDLSRRDFTINAMAADINGEIVDPFNGMVDLQSGIIRTVGSASARFSEDYLRILRACRFAVKYNFLISESVETAIYANAHNLNKISKERLYEEFMKIFECGTGARQKYLISFVLQVCVNSCFDGIPIRFQVDEQECGIILSHKVTFDMAYAILFRNATKTELEHLISLFSFTRVQKERIQLIHSILNMQGKISVPSQQTMLFNYIAIRNVRAMNIDNWAVFLELLDDLNIPTAINLNTLSINALCDISPSGSFTPEMLELNTEDIQEILGANHLLPHYHHIIQNILVNAVSSGLPTDKSSLLEYLDEILPVIKSFSKFQEGEASCRTKAELKWITDKMKSYLTIFSLIIYHTKDLLTSPEYVEPVYAVTTTSLSPIPSLKITYEKINLTYIIQKLEDKRFVVQEISDKGNLDISFSDKLDVVIYILTYTRILQAKQQSNQSLPTEIQGF